MGRPPKSAVAQETGEDVALVVRSFWPRADQAGRWPSDHSEGAILEGRIIIVTKDELIDGMMNGMMVRYEGEDDHS
jgi:hypothetical protein